MKHASNKHLPAWKDTKIKAPNKSFQSFLVLVLAIWVFMVTGCQPQQEMPTPKITVEPGGTSVPSGQTDVAFPGGTNTGSVVIGTRSTGWPGVTLQPGTTTGPGITSVPELTLEVITPGTPDIPPESESFIEPSAEMVGELWVDKDREIPPARDPRITWYSDLTVKQLWQQISTTGNRMGVLVIFKRPELERGYFNGHVLISEEELNQAQSNLLKIPGVLPWTGSSYDAEMPIMPDGRRYPGLVVSILNERALARVKSLSSVEEIEPLYTVVPMSGCAKRYAGNSADGMLYGNLVPWTFKHMGILDAWKLRLDPGRNIRIGVVDTGIDQGELQLTRDEVFSSIPSSTPRWAAHHFTVTADAWDDCTNTIIPTHGTRIAGLAAAPLDMQNIWPKKIVGVAYAADLTTVKYNDNVVALPGSVAALVKAIKLTIDDGARVVNLALGLVNYPSLATAPASVFLYDNIVTFYYTTETIFVGAAGTFVPKDLLGGSNVVFPATMTEVVAVAAVRSKNPTNPQAGYELYRSLFVPPESSYGPEVDFAAVNGDGDTPTTGVSDYRQDVSSIGGSSSGTAHLSGIIALAWAIDPTATRMTIMRRLRNSASLELIEGEQNRAPCLSQDVGCGIPDAYLAAGGSRHLAINGPRYVSPGIEYILYVTKDGWKPLRYVWDTGETSYYVKFKAGKEGTVETHSIVATNPDGRTLTAKYSVTITGGVHDRILYSPPIVREPPYPFAGGIYYIPVNFNVQMPDQCAIKSVTGQLLNSYFQNDGPMSAAVFLPWDRGYVVSQLGGLVSWLGGLGDPRRLDVHVSAWHSGISAIRMKVVYKIQELNGFDCSVPNAAVP